MTEPLRIDVVGTAADSFRETFNIDSAAQAQWALDNKDALFEAGGHGWTEETRDIFDWAAAEVKRGFDSGYYKDGDLASKAKIKLNAFKTPDGGNTCGRIFPKTSPCPTPPNDEPETEEEKKFQASKPDVKDIHNYLDSVKVSEIGDESKRLIEDLEKEQAKENVDLVRTTEIKDALWGLREKAWAASTLSAENYPELQNFLGETFLAIGMALNVGGTGRRVGKRRGGISVEGVGLGHFIKRQKKLSPQQKHWGIDVSMKEYMAARPYIQMVSNTLQEIWMVTTVVYGKRLNLLMVLTRKTLGLVH